MGSLSFQLPASISAEAEADLERACLAGGQDCMPFLTLATVESGILLVRRSIDESGFLQAPWTVEGIGRLMLTSATLMERPKPYNLLLELARGKTHQLRNQTSDWTQGGLVLPESVRQQVQEAAHAFGKAASLTEPAAIEAQAERALALGVHAARQLVETYGDQVFHVRHMRQTQLDTLWGCPMTARPSATVEPLLQSTFNTIKLPITWQDLEPSEGEWKWDALDRLVDWAAERFTVIGGPLLDFSGRWLAEWLWSRQPDLHGLADHLVDFVERVIHRYKDRIRTWQITAGSNWSGVLATNDEEMLWLTVRLVEAIRKVDPQLELIVGLAQPWGEYLANQEHNVTPFSFADTLLRTGSRIEGLELEVIMGITPRGSYCRDPLELSRLLDLYVLLGIPLHVTLGYPSAQQPDDPIADADLRVNAGRWGDTYTPEAQADWAQAFARLALCKPFVRGVSWVQSDDSTPHHFPHCGLIDAAGQPKPALEVLRRLRAEHLK